MQEMAQAGIVPENVHHSLLLLLVGSSYHVTGPGMRESV